jgi:WD40 repeat protein
VLWAEGTADGAVLSIGLDGTIARTARDGRSTVLLRDVSRLIATAYAPANHLLAYACDPSDVCLFDALREARVSAEPALRNVKIVSMAFSPDAGSLAVLSKDAALTIVDVTDPAHPRIRDTRRDHPGMTAEAVHWLLDQGIVMMGIDAITFDPPGWAMFERKQFWEAHRVMLEEDYWHLENLMNLEQLPPHGFKLAVLPVKWIGTTAAPVRALAISPDGTQALSGSFDTSAIRWSLQRNAAEQVLRFHDGAVNAVAFLPDGRIATSGEDARIAIWRAGELQPAMVLEGHKAPVVALAASPDGATLASASWDHTARLWPLAGGAPRVIEGHTQNVNGVAFTIDGRALVTVGYDATLRVTPLVDDGGGGPIVTTLPFVGRGQAPTSCSTSIS